MGEILKFTLANHSNILSNGIWNQFERKDGTDLLIVCAKGEKIKIHRWLMQIFLPQLMCEHSKKKVIKLNIDKSFLLKVLEFVYKGNVQVASSDLVKFRQTVEILKLSYLLDAISNLEKVNAGKTEECVSKENTKPKPNVPMLSILKKAVKEYTKAPENVIEPPVITEDIEEIPENIQQNDDNSCKIIENVPEIGNNGDNASIDMFSGKTVFLQTLPEGTILLKDLNLEVMELPVFNQTPAVNDTLVLPECAVEETAVGFVEEEVVTNDLVANMNGFEIIQPVPGGIVAERLKASGVKRAQSYSVLKSKKTALRIIRAKDKSVISGDTALSLLNQAKNRRHVYKVKVRCAQCEFVAENVPEFHQHMVDFHPDWNVDHSCRCAFCDFVADKMLTLRSHLKNEHKDVYKSVFRCEHCDFETEKKGAFSRHLRNSHSTDRPFACDLCDYRGMSKKNLYLHQLLHKKVTYSCDICDKVFSCQMYLRKHRKLHFKQSFICPLCSQSFSQKPSLKLHLKRTHQLSGEDFGKVCLQLDESYKPKPRFKCPLCEYCVPQKTFYLNHLACEHNVDEHLNMIEPSIKCPSCDYMCHIEAQLHAHRFKVHKILKSNRNLLEKVFCELCGHQFSSKSHLKRHHEMMHNPNPAKYMCHLCGFTTKTNGNLNQHIKRKH